MRNENELMNDLDIPNQDYGVNKGIDSYTDIVAKQIYNINLLVTNNAAVKIVTKAIDVLEALLSPYLPENAQEELQALKQEYALKLKFLRSDKRQMMEITILNRFLLDKFAILLRFAKERGFLPKELKQE